MSKLGPTFNSIYTPFFRSFRRFQESSPAPSSRGITRGTKGNNSRDWITVGVPNHCEVRRNVPTAHLLPDGLSFPHGGAKLASCSGRHQPRYALARSRLFALWVTRLLSQWMLHWKRVGSSSWTYSLGIRIRGTWKSATRARTVATQDYCHLWQLSPRTTATRKTFTSGVKWDGNPWKRPSNTCLGHRNAFLLFHVSCEIQWKSIFR